MNMVWMNYCRDLNPLYDITADKDYKDKYYRNLMSLVQKYSEVLGSYPTTRCIACHKSSSVCFMHSLASLFREMLHCSLCHGVARLQASPWDSSPRSWSGLYLSQRNVIMMFCFQLWWITIRYSPILFSERKIEYQVSCCLFSHISYYAGLASVNGSSYWRKRHNTNWS
jgi:hypothetical protein